MIIDSCKVFFFCTFYLFVCLFIEIYFTVLSVTYTHTANGTQHILSETQVVFAT